LLGSSVVEPSAYPLFNRRLLVPIYSISFFLLSSADDDKVYYRAKMLV